MVLHGSIKPKRFTQNERLSIAVSYFTLMRARGQRTEAEGAAGGRVPPANQFRVAFLVSLMSDPNEERDNSLSGLGLSQRQGLA